MACENVLGYRAPGAEAMITAIGTWADIHNFQENSSGYPRAQLTWALALAARWFSGSLYLAKLSAGRVCAGGAALRETRKVGRG
jgi:hypothetical protein